MSSKKQLVPALLSELGMPSVNPSDEFSIIYKDGMLEASVKRNSGKVETVAQTVGKGGFSQMTNFNPSDMTEKKRNILISKMYKGGRGESQSAIGRKFGLTQPQISRIIEKEKYP